MATLDPHRCMWASSRRSEWSLLSLAAGGPLIAVASLAEPGLSAQGLQKLRLLSLRAESVVVERGLGCPSARGIFLEQRSDPCPPGGQVAF